MAFCPKCGGKIPKESSFCIHCGADIKELIDYRLEGEEIKIEEVLKEARQKYKSGKYLEALKNLEPLLESDDMTALLLASSCYEGLEQYEKALNCIDKVSILDRDSKVSYQKSYLLYELKRYKEARDVAGKWMPKGSPKEVNVYDFPSLSEGKAVPYGICDIQKNKGLVNVGISHDTAEFAVESIRKWWFHFGYKQYPKADKILICADGGESNGYRNRLWKYNLQKLSDELPLSVTVCHYLPGTSKWNKIEHRMFSFISMNWRGEPLMNLETVINLIGSTKTKTGLKIQALLDTESYKTGIKISDK